MTVDTKWDIQREDCRADGRTRGPGSATGPTHGTSGNCFQSRDERRQIREQQRHLTVIVPDGKAEPRRAVTPLVERAHGCAQDHARVPALKCATAVQRNHATIWPNGIDPDPDVLHGDIASALVVHVSRRLCARGPATTDRLRSGASPPRRLNGPLTPVARPRSQVLS